MTTATAAIATYARSSAATAAPAEVVRMAYDRVLTACVRAVEAEETRESGWVQRFHDETTRAQAILLELLGALATGHSDPAVAAMSTQLADLYQFAIAGLVEANVSKSPDRLVDVHDVIEGLRDAWVEGVLRS